MPLKAEVFYPMGAERPIYRISVEKVGDAMSRLIVIPPVSNEILRAAGLWYAGEANGSMEVPIQSDSLSVDALKLACTRARRLHSALKDNGELVEDLDF